MKARYSLICVLLIVATCATTAYTWPLLPERVPVHWNAGGRG